MLLMLLLPAGSAVQPRLAQPRACAPAVLHAAAARLPGACVQPDGLLPAASHEGGLQGEAMKGFLHARKDIL
jgi:hypothetical protein